MNKLELHSHLSKEEEKNFVINTSLLLIFALIGLGATVDFLLDQAFALLSEIEKNIELSKQ